MGDVYRLEGEQFTFSFTTMIPQEALAPPRDHFREWEFSHKQIVQRENVDGKIMYDVTDTYKRAKNGKI